MSKSPDEFDIFAEEVRGMVDACFTRQWFRSSVNPDALWEAYLSGFDDSEIRQQHNCHCCKTFIKKYGGLVYIQGTELHPVVWPTYTDTKLYTEPLNNMLKLFNDCNITYPFITTQKELGKPLDPSGWTHFWVKGGGLGSLHSVKPNKEAAELATNKRMIEEFLPSTSLEMFSLVCEALKGDSIVSREKHQFMANWLKSAKRKYTSLNTHAERRNYLWHLATTSPTGFCHAKNTVVGMFIQDLQAGKSVDEARHRLNAAMCPLQYQRPQAAPTAGNIRVAERLIAELGLERSLERRMATLEDIQEYVWTPAAMTEEQRGVFSHLLQKTKKLEIPSDSYINNVSWSVFARDVLPEARGMRVKMSETLPFYGLTAAVHPDAHPLFQWDSLEHRNSVAWYTYSMGSRPAQWGLAAGEWVEVVGVIRRPDLWNGRKGEKDDIRLFLVAGAKDTHNRSLALFPETLRRELYEVRSTIEAHSRSGKLQEVEKPACAVAVAGRMPVLIEVAGEVLRRYYRIDRWG